MEVDNQYSKNQDNGVKEWGSVTSRHEVLLQQRRVGYNKQICISWLSVYLQGCAYKCSKDAWGTRS